MKGETKNIALKRILKQELGIFLKENVQDKIIEMRSYEHFYRDNFLNDKSFGTHYIVIPYLILFEKLLKKEKIKLDKQHSEIIWFDFKKSNMDNIKIHKYTLDYFKNPIIKKFLFNF